MIPLLWIRVYRQPIIYSSQYSNMTVSTQLETCALFVKTVVTNTTMTSMWFYTKHPHTLINKYNKYRHIPVVLFVAENRRDQWMPFFFPPRCCLVIKAQLLSSSVCQRVSESCNKLGLLPPSDNTSHIQRRSFIRHERAFPRSASCFFFLSPPRPALSLQTLRIFLFPKMNQIIKKKINKQISYWFGKKRERVCCDRWIFRFLPTDRRELAVWLAVLSPLSSSVCVCTPLTS